MRKNETPNAIELRRLKNEEDQLLINKISACAYVLESLTVEPSTTPFQKPTIKPILSTNDQLRVKTKLLSLVNKL